MASTKAQLAKDKGNAAFKTGDYPVAIGLYTEAILAKPDDPTFPLNRAAAYLRLGKNEDAERDCTTVLKLNATNVKALFRRAQARIALNKLSDARKDLKEALGMEPANESVQQEVKNVENLLLRAKSKECVNTPDIAPPMSASISPHRRRIPIKIVESTAGSSSKATLKANDDPTSPKIPISNQSSPNDLITPLSSRSLTSTFSNTVASKASPSSTTTRDTSPSLSPSTSTPRSSTFMDAKQARDSAKPSRAGGGIFRSSGDHTIIESDGKKGQPSNASVKAPPPVPPTAVDDAGSKALSSHSSSSMKPPMTMFDFTRSWESLDSAEKRWNLVAQIPPAALPALFQTSLETSLLVSIMATFSTILDRNSDPDNSDRVRMRQYMAMFSKVPRFKTVALFMSTKEKMLVKAVWQKVGVRNGCAAWGIDIS